MEFFIRRYVRGLKNSGTSDIFVSDVMISNEKFEEQCNMHGSGKYLLCIRGKGIRGFKKLDEFFIEEDKLVFAADDIIGLKQEVKLSEMTSNDLLNVMGSMLKNAPAEGVNNPKLMTDLSRFHAELSSRDGLQESEMFNSPNYELPQMESLVSAGFPIGTTVTSFALGALTGGIVIWLLNKSTVDELKSQIQNLESSVKNAEESINNLKVKAENIQNSIPMNMDQMFLSSYNRRNGLSGL